MIHADSLLGRLAEAARPTSPWWRLTVSPWWANVLVAAGARRAPTSGAMTATHRQPVSAQVPAQATRSTVAELLESLRPGTRLAIRRHPALRSLELVFRHVHQADRHTVEIVRPARGAARSRSLARDVVRALDLDLARDFDLAREIAREIVRNLDAAGDPALARDARRLFLAINEASYRISYRRFASAQNLDLDRAHDLAHDLASDLAHDLATEIDRAQCDFVGADLRSLRNVPLISGFLYGVRWSSGTQWPAQWAERIRRDSAEIGPDLFEIQPGSTDVPGDIDLIRA
ncbi:hypothetical protein [Micromonospora sp. S4605]|uniref:hypothetical protein n=1 Tax=Micromonospora sp. S4605 TaxID=1420897 RepID=UPI001305116C|nr:hypothetical protein [Micromonospora sp. S4605]